VNKPIGDITKTTIVLLVLAVSVAVVWYFLGPSHNSKVVQLENDSNFPRYVYNSEKSLLAYRIAITIPDVMKAVPCTCGCTVIGHTSSKDCFMNDNGSYSPHAANCDICQDIAIDAFKLFKRGYSIRKIQSILHKKYETNDQ
jgi:hypothetical protein